MSKIEPLQIDETSWQKVLQALQAGEIDRPEAASRLGIKLPTLNTRLRRGDHLKSLKEVRRNAGAYNANAEKDPDKVSAMNRAVAECLAKRETPVRAIYLASYKDQVDYVYLCRKVKKAKEERARDLERRLAEAQSTDWAKRAESAQNHAK